MTATAGDIRSTNEWTLGLRFLGVALVDEIPFVLLLGCVALGRAMNLPLQDSVALAIHQGILTTGLSSIPQHQRMDVDVAVSGDGPVADEMRLVFGGGSHWARLSLSLAVPPCTAKIYEPGLNLRSGRRCCGSFLGRRSSPRKEITWPLETTPPHP